MSEDLISRRAAIDEIDSYEVNAPDYMQGWTVKLIEAIKGDIIGLISELPSAQPDIVRCRDCIRFERNGNKEYGNCAYHLSLAYETDYCSWGERKEAD